MTISFTNIPSALRVPLFYAEVDPSKANTGAGPIQRTLLIGQKTSGGAAVSNIPVICTGVADAISKCGPGSMLALMVDKYRQNDAFGELWLLPLNDDGAGAAAAGSMLFTAQPTANGTLFFNIGDVLVTVALTSGMTVAQMATALSAAINANTNLPVTAAPTAGSVAITAKNKGLAENDIPLAVNLGGAPAGQSSPAGLTYTLTQLSGGLVNPSLTTGLGNLTDTPFDFIVMPYFDTTSLDALKTFMNDQTGRWAWSRKLYGHAFTAMVGNAAAVTTLGAARNDQHMTIMAENGSPTPHWLWAPAYVGAAAVPLKADPARPVQTIVVNGVVAPPSASRFDLTTRNTFLYTGISTFYIQADGTVRLENVITTYQKNAFSQPDDSYLEVETMFQIMFLLRDLENYVTTNYPRMKLARSLARTAPGSFIVTPEMVKQDLIGHYDFLVQNGQAQDLETFASGIVVEQDSSNHNRLNVLYDPTIMNQLRIFAVLFQFRQ